MRTITTYIDNILLLSLGIPNYAHHKIRILLGLYILKTHTLLDTLNLIIPKI